MKNAKIVISNNDEDNDDNNAKTVVVEIDSDYRISKFDNRNFMLEIYREVKDKRKNTCSFKWCQEGFFPNLAFAAKKLLTFKILNSTSSSLKDLIELVEETEKNLIKALSPYKDVLVKEEVREPQVFQEIEKRECPKDKIPVKRGRKAKSK